VGGSEVVGFEISFDRGVGWVDGFGCFEIKCFIFREVGVGI
jgi:hypothetical protein